MIHHANLSTSFYKPASSLGLEFFIGYEVSELQDGGDEVLVALQNHSVIRADLIIGADGRVGTDLRLTTATIKLIIGDRN